MTPKLFTSTSTSFLSNGVGLLSDAVSCVVTEERNGMFELVMEYPVTGIHYPNIELRSIIVADANRTLTAQPFRVYQIDKPINGVVVIYAQHISYDMTGIPVTAFTASNAAAAVAGLSSHSAITNPFTFTTDKTTSANFAVEVPSSCRSLLGGQEGSILDVYGGEWGFDNYTATLYAHRGANRGVTIRYGKNLTDLTQEENCSSVYTGVLPFWYFEGSPSVVGNIVYASGTYDFTRIMPLDLSDRFTDPPTIAQLTSAATSYIEANNIGVPHVSLTISFVDLTQTEEFKDLALLETVYLCDTVKVEFEKLGVSATAKVIRTDYNVLLNKYDEIEIGDARVNIADTIAEQALALENANSHLSEAVFNATRLITGNLGGYVVLHSSTGGATPDEILIMDTDSISTATHVWRWNASGLGYSSTGYNGPYGLAMTIDGSIVADYITTGTLTAALIKAGVLSSSDGTLTFDVENAILTTLSSTGKVQLFDGGIIFYDNNNQIVGSFIGFGSTSVLKASTVEGTEVRGNSLELRNAGDTEYVAQPFIQTGSSTVSGSTSKSITFPYAYSSAPTVIVSWADTTSATLGILNVSFTSASSFTVGTSGSNPTSAKAFNWVAFGF